MSRYQRQSVSTFAVQVSNASYIFPAIKCGDDVMLARDEFRKARKHLANGESVVLFCNDPTGGRITLEKA
jgi:hypothetical protein